MIEGRMRGDFRSHGYIDKIMTEVLKGYENLKLERKYPENGFYAKINNIQSLTFKFCELYYNDTFVGIEYEYI